MKRLEQRQAVEQDQRLGLLPAADVREPGQAVAGRAGQSVHGAQRLVTEPRQALDFLLRQESPRAGVLVREAVLARGHDDLLERPRWRRRGPRARDRGTGRRPAGRADHREGAVTERLEHQAVWGQDRRRKRFPAGRLGLAEHAEVRRHELVIENERHAAGDELLEHLADQAARIGLGERARRREQREGCREPDSGKPPDPAGA